jgi:hypothetical protein
MFAVSVLPDPCAIGDVAVAVTVGTTGVIVRGVDAAAPARRGHFQR